MIVFRKARESEYNTILGLINQNELPTSDLDPGKLRNFLVAEKENVILGCGGLEIFGSEALLRSLSIRPDFQNKGLGSQLLEKLVEYAADSGIENLHLLTLTAQKFFIKHGFILAERKNAPAVIQQTGEFSGICPTAGSVYMKFVNLKPGKN